MSVETGLKAEIVQYLKTSFELDDETATELMNTFIETVNDYAKQVDALLTERNWQDLSRLGHTIKGTSANVGANALSDAGRELEFAAKNAHYDSSKIAIDKLKQLINAIS
ncbi:MAG: Hpt domain-containing protein [Victivallaceae bacterium]